MLCFFIWLVCVYIQNNAARFPEQLYKDSANRTKIQINLIFSEMQPIFEASLKDTKKYIPPPCPSDQPQSRHLPHNTRPISLLDTQSYIISLIFNKTSEICEPL